MAVINFSGIASGIDSASLIETLISQQRRSRIEPLENRINSLTEQNESFSELKTFLATLKSSASTFRTLNGGGVAKQATSSDDSVLSATATNSALNGSYSLTVNSLAKNATGSFTDTYASTSEVLNAGLGSPANVSIDIGTGSNVEEVNIEVTNTTTVDQFVTAFNAATDRATASVVNTGTSASPQYQIVISTADTGTDEGSLTFVDKGGVFTGDTLSQATNASVTIDGLGTVARSSNTINDIFSGVTLSLTNTGTSTLTVGTDTSATVSNLQSFVDAYNEIVLYQRENDAISRDDSEGEPTILYGSLSSTSLDENLITSLRSAMSSSGTSGGTVNVLADLGITTNRDGTLSLDTDVAKEALAADPEGATTVLANLGENLASVGDTIDQFTQFNGLIDASVNSNTNSITNYNRRIAVLESALVRQEESLVSQFARLESLIGKLNSAQQQLTSILG